MKCESEFEKGTDKIDCIETIYSDLHRVFWFSNTPNVSVSSQVLWSRLIDQKTNLCHLNLPKVVLFPI